MTLGLNSLGNYSLRTSRKSTRNKMVPGLSYRSIINLSEPWEQNDSTVLWIGLGEKNQKDLAHIRNEKRICILNFISSMQPSLEWSFCNGFAGMIFFLLPDTWNDGGP